MAVAAPNPPDFRELGVTGSTSYGGLNLIEYNSELRGISGIKIYDQMKRSDAQVRASLRLVKTPIMSAQWYVEPASGSLLDQEIAEFVEANLFRNKNFTFMRLLYEALLCLDYGFYLFEKVFEPAVFTPVNTYKRPRTRQVVQWRKLAPRHPITVSRWYFDRTGDPVGVQQFVIYGNDPNQIIPADKLLIFTVDQEAGDPSGISILRSAYKNWFYKENLYTVDAIQKERHGIGIPHVQLPPNFTPNDKKFANEMAANLRTNEKAHVVTPPGWIIDFIEPKGQLVDALKSAEHHGLMILQNVLVQFLALGTTDTGTMRSQGSQIDVFQRSLKYVADLVRGVINTSAIPQLVNYNYTVHGDYPELRVRRLGEGSDFRAFAVGLRNLVEPGILTATPELEEWVSDQLDFPAPSPEAMKRQIEDRLKKPTTPFGGGSPNPSVKPTNADGSRQGSRTGGPVE